MNNASPLRYTCRMTDRRETCLELEFVQLEWIVSKFVFLGLSFFVINTKNIPEESTVGPEAQRR